MVACSSLDFSIKQNKLKALNNRFILSIAKFINIVAELKQKLNIPFR